VSEGKYKPDLSLELDFNVAITPETVNSLIREQATLMQAVVGRSGPAFTEALTSLHDRIDLNTLGLAKAGFSAADRGQMQLALAFMAKQVFIEVWRLSHKAQLAGHKTHGGGKKNTKGRKKR